ncbi:MAG: FmdB family zinc ribbon protein [Candidatus Binataceae bacterium]
MPIYEYQCAKCGVFEVTQRITEPSLKKCPTCKGKVERLISHTSFILKGSGWYATDYARSGSHRTDADHTAAASSDTSANGSAISSASSDSEKSGKSDKSDKSDKPVASGTDKSASDKATAAKPAD